MALLEESQRDSAFSKYEVDGFWGRVVAGGVRVEETVDEVEATWGEESEFLWEVYGKRVRAVERDRLDSLWFSKVGRLVELGRYAGGGFFQRLAIYEDMKAICSAKIEVLVRDAELFIVRTDFLRSLFYRIGVPIENVKGFFSVFRSYFTANSSTWAKAKDFLRFSTVVLVRFFATGGRFLEDARYTVVDVHDRVLY